MKNTLLSAPRQQCYSYKLKLYVVHIISSYDIIKTEGKLLIITSNRPSVTGLNCRPLTSFVGRIKYVPGMKYS